MVHPLPSLDAHVSARSGVGRRWFHTLAPFTLGIYTRRGHQHIVDDREAAFAAQPLTGLGENANIVEDGRLIEQDASAVDRTREWHLLGMEVVESGLPPDLIRLVAQNIENRVRGKENVGIGSEVWRFLESTRG